VAIGAWWRRAPAWEVDVRRTRGDREVGVALNLFGVTFAEAGMRGPAVPGTELIAVRDLGAIVAPGAYSVVEPTEERATVMAGAISAYAKRAAVLPAPLGVVFRSREALTRWLELHYVALSDALSFVDDRVVGRVHVWRPGEASEREVGSDLAAAAADALRDLRRLAVATVPLRTEQLTGIVLSAAFLVEQELWNEFASKVGEQVGRAPNIRLELTGPWPPFDFVHMQFGG
jgi:Gas vesicle synthesis protein GvpL/GvpF